MHEAQQSVESRFKGQSDLPVDSVKDLNQTEASYLYRTRAIHNKLPKIVPSGQQRTSLQVLNKDLSIQ